jgi:hypothetical protein
MNDTLQRVGMVLFFCVISAVFHDTRLGTPFSYLAYVAGVANIIGIILDNHNCNTENPVPYSEHDKARDAFNWILAIVTFVALIVAYMKTH